MNKINGTYRGNASGSILRISFGILALFIVMAAYTGVVGAQGSSVIFDPPQDGPGAQVKAIGSSWSPGHTIYMTWLDNQSYQATVDNNGNFEITLVVPSDAKPGQYTITFEDRTGNLGYFIPATFTVTAPISTPSPTPTPTATPTPTQTATETPTQTPTPTPTPEPTQTTPIPTETTPTPTPTIEQLIEQLKQLKPGDVVTEPIFLCIVGPDGRLGPECEPQQWRQPEPPSIEDIIRVIRMQPPDIREEFIKKICKSILPGGGILCEIPSPVPGIFDPPNFAPQQPPVDPSMPGDVKINPSEGVRGTQVTATGTNWQPGHTIHVLWDGNEEIKQSKTIVDPDGKFSITFDVPSDARLRLGPHSIWFWDEQGGGIKEVIFTVMSSTV